MVEPTIGELLSAISAVQGQKAVEAGVIAHYLSRGPSYTISALIQETDGPRNTTEVTTTVPDDPNRRPSGLCRMFHRWMAHGRVGRIFHRYAAPVIGMWAL